MAKLFTLALATTLAGLLLGGTVARAANPLPVLRMEAQEADQDQLHELLHAAHLLAHRGMEFEAARVLASIAHYAADYEVGEEANRILHDWGLSIQAVQEKPAEEVAQIVAKQFRGRFQLEAQEGYLHNLVGLERYEQAAAALEQLPHPNPWRASADEWNREQLAETFRLLPSFRSDEAPLTTGTLADALAQAHQARLRLIEIFRLQGTDPEAAELAHALIQRFNPEWRRHEDHDEEHEIDEDERSQSEERTALLTETAGYAVRHAEDQPKASRVLVQLIRLLAPDSPQAAFVATLPDLPETEVQHQPMSKGVRSPFPDPDPAQALFEPLQIHDYAIELSPEAFALLQEEPKHYVRGTFRSGDMELQNVGIRLKGGWGSFRDLTDTSKSGFTIKFNHFENGQRFQGVRRIVLNNAVQDPSYLRESLGYSIFRDAGIPAPRTTYASVTLNGRRLGLYVQIEAVTKDFLKRWFKKTGGNLYEGPGDVTEWRELDLDSNQDRADRTDLRSLARAIAEADDANPWPALDQHVVPLQFARFLAVEQFVNHWDGYTQVNNYRIYRNPKTDRFEFLPHGADQLFEDPYSRLTHQQGGILGRALLQTEFGREQFERVARDLITTSWDESTLRERIAERYLLVRPFLQANENSEHLARFDETVRHVLHYIQTRRFAIERELNLTNRNRSWREPQHEFHPHSLFEAFW